jgi:hypothetical protein
MVHVLWKENISKIKHSPRRGYTPEIRKQPQGREIPRLKSDQSQGREISLELQHTPKEGKYL